MPQVIETPSPTDAGIQDFLECLRHLRDGHPAEGLTHVQRALDVAPQNPFYLSYKGLLKALTEHNFIEAEKLCREAVRLKRNHPQPYLNLAEVYVRAGRPVDAVETLEKGLLSVGRDLRIRRALESIGLRREPVLPSLPRSNPLNRVLGKLRHHLLGPLHVE